MVVTVDRLVVDLHPDGSASVLTWLDGDVLAESGPRFPLDLPLGADALDDLRWYLEDYLILPSGVYGERGEQIQETLPRWGEELFRAVFGAGPARDAYLSVRARGSPMLVLRSQSPELLALPWELMRDPARPAPLALDVAGISRSLPAQPGAQALPVPDGKLRVLMVIARPGGARDIGYQMIARPLVGLLGAVHGEVDLTILRPPTVAALEAALAEAKRHGTPYQVVHFDGHGGQTGEGILVFEKPDGGPHWVSATTLARALADVPVVVLNACQSAAIGTDLAATIATRLLQAGTTSVVAMAYSVYAVAAAEFMAAFYDRLFAGDPVSTAVTVGRQAMYRNSTRPSRKPGMTLADWMVPVHYLRSDVSFPQLGQSRSGEDTADHDAVRRPADDLDPVGAFAGRDWLICQLESAARLDKVILLHGTAGTGKTELAKAFARWWRDTAGTDKPEYVFFHSFEPGVAASGLDGVVNAIGMELFGTGFGRLDQAERSEAVQTALTAYRMLLIWDNFESVRSMPERDPLDEDGCRQILGFLSRMTEGNTAVLITSRTAERWLGGIRRLTVGGLTAPEANQYAEQLLAGRPAAQTRRADPAFGDLMEWLDGHPLAMRLTLPHLDSTEPAVLLDGLRGTGTPPRGEPVPGPEAGGDGRLTSLSASIAYSYAHLSMRTRRLLPAACLFQGYTDAGLLPWFAETPGVPPRFRGADGADWQRALHEAAATGLLTRVGDSGFFRIHPALPAFLDAQWRADEPAISHQAERDAAMRALTAAYGKLCHSLYQELISGDARWAYAILELHRRTLGNVLGYALARGMWAEADQIRQAMDRYWANRGLIEEADAWLDRILLAIEDDDGAAPDADSPAASLWLTAVTMRAIYQGERLRIEQAEQTVTRIRGWLDRFPSSQIGQQRLFDLYQQLTYLASRRGRTDEAGRWAREALAIAEQGGDKVAVFIACHQLGVITQDAGQLGDAETWYRKALVIEEELGDRPAIAGTCHQLGTIFEHRGRLVEAADWSRRALSIRTEIGDRRGLAATSHQLGNIAHRRGRLAEAESWYNRALVLGEELGDAASVAATYHQLGMVAEDRGQLDVAETWYRQALAMAQRTGHPPQLAMTYGQLGLVAAQRGDLTQALDWTVRCVSLFAEFPHPLTGPAPRYLAQFTASLGLAALEEAWRKVTGDPLPQPVRDYVTDRYA